MRYTTVAVAEINTYFTNEALHCTSAASD